MTATVVGDRPPSPPLSHDGDFGLGAVQQHVAGLEKHAPPRLIRPAPVSLSDPEMVSDPQSEMPQYMLRKDPDSCQDLYGDPSMYQTAQNYTYYPVQPVSSLIHLKVEEDANMVSADVRTDDQPAHPS